MRPIEVRRRIRPRRPLPFTSPSSTPGPRSLLCVDLRTADMVWSQRPIQDIRHACRGGRLGWLLAELDVDPRCTLQRTAHTLHPARACQLFDALCEEVAESMLHDVPYAVCRSLLPLLAPHGSAECPYPPDCAPPAGPVEGLVVLVEGRLAAESAAVALAGAFHPPGNDAVDPALWADIVAALHPMLEAVRDRSRSLLMES
ncbi:MAG: hypothetical protein RMK29_17620 [Myxococcales bacterium]|nr:hypothetical protein [Myxococcota bacterium]MDW8283530.1 hypothetical protein [Myxococcales bacterium]